MQLDARLNTALPRMDSSSSAEVRNTLTSVAMLCAKRLSSEILLLRMLSGELQDPPSFNKDPVNRRPINRMVTSGGPPSIPLNSLFSIF